MSNARKLASPFLLDANKDIISSAFPNGVVQQVVINNHTLNSEYTFAYNASYNFPTISITPKSTSSTIIFWANPVMFSRAADRSSAAYGWTNMYVVETTSGSTSSTGVLEWLNYADSYANPDGYRQQYQPMCHFSNSVTTQRDFNLRATCHIANGQGRVGNMPRYSHMLIEVE